MTAYIAIRYEKPIAVICRDCQFERDVPTRDAGLNLARQHNAEMHPKQQQGQPAT